MFYGGPLSYRAFFLVSISMLSLPPVARAAFEIVSHDVLVDVAKQRTTFTVSFNRPPDFSRNAFQYFYDAQPADGEVDFSGEDVVIIRGAEIAVADTIPIRESLNPTGEEFPNAEGWGPMLGEVEYDLDGATVDFVAGWELLREADEAFGYHLFALDDGELTSAFTFLYPRFLVPLPPALPAGAMLLVAAWTRRRI